MSKKQNIVTPIEFLQNELPNFVKIITKSRRKSRLNKILIGIVVLITIAGLLAIHTNLDIFGG